MFKKEKELEALETMEAEQNGQQEQAGKKRFSLKKRAPKEKKEKVPLTKEQKKKRRKRIIIGAIVVVLLAVFILPKLFAPEVLPMVTVTEASLGSVEQTIDGSGTVKSEQVKTYFSPVSATVADFDLKVGDTVDAGEMLLTYDEAELDELYKQAELTGTAANYGYQDAITKNNENVSEYNRSSAALNDINQRLDAEEDENEHVQDRITEYTAKQADASNELVNRQIALEDAQTTLKAAQAQLETVKEKKKKAEEAKEAALKAKADAEAEGDADKIAVAEEEIKTAQADIDDSNTQIATLEATVKAATNTRNAAQQKIQEQQNSLNEINEKLNKYQDRLKDSSERLSDLQTDKAKEEGIKDSSDASILSSAAKQELAANNNLSTLNAQMTKDDINEGKAGIKAEFSGVVTEVSAVPGGPSAKGGSLFSIASNEDVIVDMSVTRYDLEKLEVGQSAEISLAGQTYTGTVTKLSRLAAANEKGTPVVSAEVHIDNPDDNVYLGLEAKVKVSGHKVQDVIVVPVEAVNTGKDGSFVYTVEDGIVVKKPVETGLFSDTLVEITSGLSFGEKVIKSGGEMVDEGMKVTAMEE